MKFSLRSTFSRESRHWEWSLRVGAIVAELSSLIAFLVMGLTYSAPACDVNFCSFHKRGWDVLSIPLLTIALAWNIAEFVTARVNGRGIHPGAHVALDLCLFGGLLSASVLTLIFFSPTAAHIAAVPFEMLTCLLHSILLVLSCAELHNRVNHDRANLLALTHKIMDVQELNNKAHLQLQNSPPQIPQLPQVPQLLPPATDIEMATLPALPPGLAYVVTLPPSAHPVLRQDGVMYYAVPEPKVDEKKCNSKGTFCKI